MRFITLLGFLVAMPFASGAEPASPPAKAKGWVIVVGTIGADGAVAEVRVHRARPAGVFDAAALRTVKTWRFTPLVVKGKAVPRPFQQLIRFDLTDDAAPSAGDAPTAAAAPPAAAPNDDLIPVNRVAPEWPRQALVDGISGVVTVRGIVRTDGKTRDLSVVSASPPGVFDRATLRAVARWEFKPRLVDGVPVEREFVQTIHYNLMDDRQSPLLKLVTSRRDAVSALYHAARDLCPDLYPRAKDAVNGAFAVAAAGRGLPALVFPEAPDHAVAALHQVGGCVFTSWEQFADPAAWSVAAELASIIDPATSPEQRAALKAQAATLSAAGADPTGAPRAALAARSWVLAQAWSGYFELLFAHSSQFPAAPPAAQATLDAIETATDALERMRTDQALAGLRKAYAASQADQDRAQLALTIARIEAGRRGQAAAVVVLSEVVDLPAVPWNLRQAVRLALARFSGELGDQAGFESMLAAVNAELAAGDRLAF